MECLCVVSSLKAITKILHIILPFPKVYFYCGNKNFLLGTLTLLAHYWYIEWYIDLSTRNSIVFLVI